MKYILIIVLFSLTIESCDEERIAYTTLEDSLKIECKKMLVERLKDPESYVNKGWIFKTYTNEQYTEAKKKFPDHYKKFYPTLIIHKYKANNSFGANLLGEAFFTVDSTNTITQFDSFEKLPYYMRIY